MNMFQPYECLLGCKL